MRPLRLIMDFLSYDGTTTNDPADAIKVKNKIEESDVSEVSRQQLVIADAVTDQSITLPDVSCDYLLILIDRQVSIKLNGSVDAIILKPRANGTKSLGFFTKGSITELSMSNASGATAKIDVIAVKI